MAEKKKSKAAGRVAGGVGVVGVLGAAAYLLTQCGAGFGFGGTGGEGSSQGSGAGDTTTTAVTAEADTTAETTTALTALTSEATTTAETVQQMVGVTVNGNDYFYENRSYSLDDLMEALKNRPAGSGVLVDDQGASLNAYNALLSALDSAGISYAEEHPE